MLCKKRKSERFQGVLHLSKFYKHPLFTGLLGDNWLYFSTRFFRPKNSKKAIIGWILMDFRFLEPKMPKIVLLDHFWIAWKWMSC